MDEKNPPALVRFAVVFRSIFLTSTALQFVKWVCYGYAAVQLLAALLLLLLLLLLQQRCHDRRTRVSVISPPDANPPQKTTIADICTHRLRLGL